jgi:TPR repeat protein
VDDGLGCTKLVYLWMRGEAGPRDEAKARQYAEKACSLGEGSGCSNLGFLWANGQGGPRDVAKGREYAQKVCSLGDSDACANARAFSGNGASSASCEEQCQKLAKDGRSARG